MSLYIRPSSQHYEYARRIARGESYATACRELGVKPGTAKKWRYLLRCAIERETGTRFAYQVAAFIATLPPDQQATFLHRDSRK